MATQSNRKYKSYMKPAAKRVTIQKPQQKGKVLAAKLIPGGFSRISDSKIRKVYK
jgi:hypothetical protein